MAGGHAKYRHLSRNSSARQALLRGLVTQLVEHEHIHTTYAKAKEAQRLAEKLITMARKNTENSKRSAQGVLYTPDRLLPKLFGEIRERYVERARGCTRVTRTEPKLKPNEYHRGGEYAILELVDGPKDSRFMMTAKTVARDRFVGKDSTPVTKQNIEKVTRYRGQGPFEDMVSRFMSLNGLEPKEHTLLSGDRSETLSREAGEAEQVQQTTSAEAEVGKMAQREEARTRKLFEGYTKKGR